MEHATDETHVTHGTNVGCGLRPFAVSPFLPFVKFWLLAPLRKVRFLPTSVAERTLLALRMSKRAGHPDGPRLIDRRRVDSRSSKARTAV